MKIRKLTIGMCIFISLHGDSIRRHMPTLACDARKQNTRTNIITNSQHSASTRRVSISDDKNNDGHAIDNNRIEVDRCTRFSIANSILYPVGNKSVICVAFLSINAVRTHFKKMTRVSVLIVCIIMCIIFLTQFMVLFAPFSNNLFMRSNQLTP